MVNYFVCATPYHIINSIFLVNNYFLTDINIILLTNNCKEASKFIELLDQERIFDKCIYIDDSKLRNDESGVFKHYKLLLKRYFGRTLIDEFVEIKITADRMIAFSFTMFNTLIQSKLMKMNNNLEIYVGEDGIRDYIYKGFGISESVWLRIIKLIRICMGYPLITLPDAFRRFLYRPQLREDLYNDKALSILKSSDISDQIEVINRIFGFSSEAHIKEKYIYFDSIYSDEIMDLQREVIRYISQCCDDFILKQHPRSVDSFDGVRTYQYSYIPWEVICMNCDLNNKVLITINSNSCFSPKFILNSEPKIIFLYKLFFKEQQLCDIEKLVMLLKTAYVNKERIIIPRSIEELKVVLQEC